jgi:hypothetical protein
MPDFRKSRAGDRCYHLRWGECLITKVDAERVYIRSLPPNGNITGIFSTTGRAYDDDENPVLYHSRPEITDPPPPKRLVKKTVWQNWYHSSYDKRKFYPGTAVGERKEEVTPQSTETVRFIGTFGTEIEYEEDE